MKYCPGCRANKSVAEFSKNKRRHDGLTNYCRICWRAVSRTQYLKNREKIADRARDKRATSGPPLRTKRNPVACASCGLNFQGHRDVTTCLPCRHGRAITHGTASTYSARGCRCRPCTDAATTVALRNKRKRLAESGLLDDTRYRTRVRRHGGKYEHVDRQSVFDRDGWCCGVCAEPVDRAIKWPDPMSVSLDHIVPLARGGDHTYDNVQCTHLTCNQGRRRVDALIDF